MVGSSLRRPRSARAGPPCQAGAKRELAGDKRRASGGAALLGVIGHKLAAFCGQAINVRGAVAHHALMVGAEVPYPDVVAHDDQDVGFFFFSAACSVVQHSRIMGLKELLKVSSWCPPLMNGSIVKI